MSVQTVRGVRGVGRGAVQGACTVWPQGHRGRGPAAVHRASLRPLHVPRSLHHIYPIIHTCT